MALAPDQQQTETPAIPSPEPESEAAPEQESVQGLNAITEIVPAEGDPNIITLDEVFARPEPQPAEPEAEAEAEPAAPEPPKVVKIGRDEFQIGGGDDQWREDQMQLIRVKHNENRSLASERDTVSNHTATLAAENERLRAQLGQQANARTPEGPTLAPALPQAPALEQSQGLAEIRAIEEDIGTDGRISVAIGKVLQETNLAWQTRLDAAMKPLKQRTEHLTVQQRTEMAGREMADELADFGLDMNQQITTIDANGAETTETIFARALAWQNAFLKSLKPRAEPSRIQMPGFT